MMLLAAAALSSTATSPFPGTAECGVLERLGAAAVANPVIRSAALEIFERIAEERMATADADLEVRAGLTAGHLRIANYHYYTVRSCALRAIARLDMPEALAYLASLQRAQFDDGGFGGQVWSSAQIALREAQFNRLPDESAKIRFLEDTTAETRSAAAWWAVDELCNRGVYQALPFIRAYLTKVNPLPRGIEHRMTFCQQRMDVISRDPDRINALASVLIVRNLGGDSDLVGWAIGQLREMHSARAEGEVVRFADEIDDLPDDSPLKSELWSGRVQIRGMGPRQK
jgi:hypothetical protein